MGGGAMCTAWDLCLLPGAGVWGPRPCGETSGLGGPAARTDSQARQSGSLGPRPRLCKTGLPAGGAGVDEIVDRQPSRQGLAHSGCSVLAVLVTGKRKSKGKDPSRRKQDSTESQGADRVNEAG